MTEIKSVSPHADFYPMLSDEALEELAADIAENGQRDPITITPKGVLLDGRNRLKACEIAGVDPIIEVYEGSDEGAFVRSRNERRHQPTGSRAMSTALSLIEDDLRGEGRWKYGAIENPESGVLGKNWKERLREAGLVLDYAADLAEAVVNGTMTLDAAYKEAKAEKDRLDNIQRERMELAKREEREEEAARQFFIDNNDAGKWLADRPGQHKTLASAYAQYEAENKEVRLEAERRRREEEARERERVDALKRDATRIKAFLTGYGQAWGMRTHPDRDEVLNMLDPTEKKRFITIEKELAWPPEKN